MEFLTKCDMKINKSRRVFILSSAVALAGLSLINRFNPFRQEKTRTAKFLTRDGKLVEVPITIIPKKKEPITKEKLLSWIWKNNKAVT